MRVAINESGLRLVHGDSKEVLKSIPDDSFHSVVTDPPYDTRWFQENAFEGTIVFIKGRLKFGNQPNPAPFPSALVVLGPNVPSGVCKQMSLKS